MTKSRVAAAAGGCRPNNISRIVHGKLKLSEVEIYRVQLGASGNFTFLLKQTEFFYGYEQTVISREMHMPRVCQEIAQVN